MTYQESVGTQARLWIGYRESPANPTVFPAGLDRPAEARGQGFVQFVSASAGYKQPYPTPGVGAIGHWAQQHGIWIVSTKATPGCQICYDWKNGDGREPVDPLDTHTGLYIGGGPPNQGGEQGPPPGRASKFLPTPARHHLGPLHPP